MIAGSKQTTVPREEAARSSLCKKSSLSRARAVRAQLLARVAKAKPRKLISTLLPPSFRCIVILKTLAKSPARTIEVSLLLHQRLRSLVIKMNVKSIKLVLLSCLTLMIIQDQNPKRIGLFYLHYGSARNMNKLNFKLTKRLRSLPSRRRLIP